MSTSTSFNQAITEIRKDINKMKKFMIINDLLMKTAIFVLICKRK